MTENHKIATSAEGTIEKSCGVKIYNDLFQLLAEKGLREHLRDGYGGAGMDGGGNPNAFLLPEKFSAIVARHPGEYHVVQFFPNNAGFPVSESRVFGEQRLTLSTALDKNQAEMPVIEYHLYAPELLYGESADKFVVEVSGSINEADFNRPSLPESGVPERPHGRFSHAYFEDGTERRDISMHISRFDEFVTHWAGKDQVVRFLRDYKHNTEESGEPKIQYKESVMIGRLEEGGMQTAEIRFSIGEGEKLVIEVGIPIGELERELYCDTEDVEFRVYKHAPQNLGWYDVLATSDFYQRLFSEELDSVAIKTIISDKIKALHSDWSKPNSVYDYLHGRISNTKQIKKS